MSSTHDRRSFMSLAAALTGLAAMDRSTVSADAQATAPSTKWDLAWLDEFKGKHRQVFDYGSTELGPDPAALRYVGHYLQAHREVFGLESPDINTIVGIMFAAFPINASDALWEKYKLGELWKIVDPKTKEPAVRNIYLEDNPLSPGVTRLQGRGTTFWQCNVALGKVVLTLAQATRTAPLTVRNEIIAGMNPGVRLVPAHVMVLGLMQEKGFAYMKP
jgi:hypothetical protein